MSLFYNHLVFGICIVNRLGSLYDYYISTYELLLKSQLQNKYQLKVLFKIISGTLTFQGGCSSLLVSTEFIIFLIRYLLYVTLFTKCTGSLLTNTFSDIFNFKHCYLKICFDIFISERVKPPCTFKLNCVASFGCFVSSLRANYFLSFISRFC